MKWAFVDYENVGSLESLDISAYQRMLVFCGPKNTRIKIGSLPNHRFCQIEFIGLTTMGSNNLDFHLAFHLGRFHEIAGKDVTFHIISNDSGFNGLVRHVEKLGRGCKKVVTKAAAPGLQPAPGPLSESASLVLARLELLEGRKRPRKTASLGNWIKAQCQGMTGAGDPDDIYKELVGAKLIHQSGTDITYAIEHKKISQG